MSGRCDDEKPPYTLYRARGLRAAPVTWQTTLGQYHLCPEARSWAAGQPSAYAAWRSCQRGDWLLWIAVKVGVDRRLLVRAACACAREALVYVPEDEERPRLAIETAEAWCDGRATLDEVRNAATAAAYAAATAATAAAYAAYPAAYPADDTADAYAAYAAATAATAAAYAAYPAAGDTADAYDATRGRSLAHSAKLVRRHIPWSAVKEAAGV